MLERSLVRVRNGQKPFDLGRLEEVLNDEDVWIQVPNLDRLAAVKAPQRMRREEDGTKLGAKRWSWDHTSRSPLQWMGFFAH
eukprot:1061069-Rhodomonas_salina.1